MGELYIEVRFDSNGVQRIRVYGDRGAGWDEMERAHALLLRINPVIQHLDAAIKAALRMGSQEGPPQ